MNMLDIGMMCTPRDLPKVCRPPPFPPLCVCVRR
jgi:hypothetical protein